MFGSDDDDDIAPTTTPEPKVELRPLFLRSSSRHASSAPSTPKIAPKPSVGPLLLRPFSMQASSSTLKDSNRAKEIYEKHLQKFGLTLDSDLSFLDKKTKVVKFSHVSDLLKIVMLVENQTSALKLIKKLSNDNFNTTRHYSTKDKNIFINVYDYKCYMFGHNAELYIASNVGHSVHPKTVSAETTFSTFFIKPSQKCPNFLEIFSRVVEGFDMLLFSFDDFQNVDVRGIMKGLEKVLNIPEHKSITDITFLVKIGPTKTGAGCFFAITEDNYQSLKNEIIFDQPVICFDCIKDREPAALMVAEKPQMAKNLVKILGTKKIYTDSKKDYTEVQNLILTARFFEASISIMSSQLVMEESKGGGTKQNVDFLNNQFPELLNKISKSFDFVVFVNDEHGNMSFSQKVKEFIQVPGGSDNVFEKTISFNANKLGISTYFDVDQLYSSMTFSRLKNFTMPKVLIVVQSQENAKLVADNLLWEQNEYNGFYRFHRDIFGRKTIVTMISLFGHIYTSEFGDRINEEPMYIFDAKIVEKVNEKCQQLPEKLAEIAKKCDFTILWMDCDYEGENINKEVISCIKNTLNPEQKNMDFIWRAKFSSSTEAPKAMENLLRPNIFHSLAMKCKHDIDFYEGCAFSRHLNNVLKNCLPNHHVTPVSFGPCRSLCLKLCVDQYNRRQKYLRNPKFCLGFVVHVGDEKIQACSRPFNTKKEALKCFDKIKDNQYCTVKNGISTEKIIVPAPNALNSTAYLKFSSRYLGIRSKNAALSGQRSYQDGQITYPRTNSTKYPEGFDIQSLYEKLFLEGLLLNDSKLKARMENGISKGGHPPLIPTEAFRKVGKTQSELLILRWFKASLMPDYSFFCESTIFKIGDYEFEYHCFKPDEDGFTEALPEMKVSMSEFDFSKEFIPGAKFLNMML